MSSESFSSTSGAKKNPDSFRLTGVLNELASIVPAMEYGNNKGKGGRVCIVGGSLIHTGAPFFAGHSAICCGVDEVTVLTTRSAAIPIKCYSPALQVLDELPEEAGMLSGDEFIERVWPVVGRNHAFCIGPGLGRNTITFHAVSKLICKVRASGIPLVMDDDALWLLASEPTMLSKNLPKSPVILTPNCDEFRRLWVALSTVVPSGLVSSDNSRSIPSLGPGSGLLTTTLSSVLDRGSQGNEGVCWQDSDTFKKNPLGLMPVVAVDCPQCKLFDVNKYSDVTAIQQTALLASMIGTDITILRKGYIDLIASPSKCFMLSQAQVPRRCGGQGAVVAGLCTTFLAWMKLAGNLDNPLLAAEGAAIITRQAAQCAFERKDRSMQTPDIIAVLSGVMEKFLAATGVDALDIIVFEKEDPQA